MRIGEPTGKLKDFPGVQEVKNRNNLREIKKKKKQTPSEPKLNESKARKGELKMSGV